MRRLHPSPTRDLPDITDVYGSYRLPDATATHVRINMVTSLDGRVTDADGLSGGLGGDGDLMVFRVLRHQADAIVVGAGTARAEDYGGMVVRDDLRELRLRDGRDAPAPVVVVTRSADLDPGSRLVQAQTAPIIMTCAAAPEDRRSALAEAGADVVLCGDGDVDLARALAILADDRGLRHVLCEGGPALNGQLLQAGLADELCLTVAARLVGGDDPRRVVTDLPGPVEAALTAVHADGQDLLLRYGLSPGVG